MSEKEGYKKHPIQLEIIKVLELFIKVNENVQQSELPDSGSFNLYHGHSEYDEDNKSIAIKIGVRIDKENEDSPFSLKAELIGVFSVDDSIFPLKHLNSWAKKNAPLIIYPYLREHVYSLTSRAGFDGVLLPLFEVPTFRLETKKS